MALVSSSPCSPRPFPTSDRWDCRPSSYSSSSLHTSMAATPGAAHSPPLRSAPKTRRFLLLPPSTTPPSPSLRPSPRTSSGPLLVSAFAPSMNSTLLLTASKDHKKFLAECEFEALKERISGKREEFRRVSCINATVPLSQISNLADDLCAACKFSYNGEDRVVVGTLDLNQCLRLPDEIVGKEPQCIGADFAREYLSNVCVAAELHRNGLGYAVIAKSKLVAQEWGKE